MTEFHKERRIEIERVKEDNKELKKIRNILEFPRKD